MMIATLRGLIVFLVIVLSPLLSNATGDIDLPRDTNGWTIFSPSTDSIIAYVSASGNDTTGRAYVQSGGDNITTFDHPDWSNPQDPTGTIYAFATYAAAYAKTRSNYPDWVLLKRGDTFTGGLGSLTKNGRSITEPFLIGAYGSTGALPLIESGSDFGARFISYRRYLAISGIDFYSNTRDPDSPDYIDDSGQAGLSFLGGESESTSGILVEGCKIRYYENGISINLYDNGTGVTVRRNLISDSYGDGGSHSQGILASAMHTGTLILEENVFDHNGWLIQADGDELPQEPGEANMFNHNIYMSGVRNATVSRNLSIRPSSIGIKIALYEDGPDVGGPYVWDNNLIIDGEIGITIAGANSPTAYRAVDVTIVNNVITNLNRSNARNHDLANGIDLLDIDGGVVANNVIVHNNETNSHAFSLDGAASRNLSIDNNVVYDFQQLGYGVWFESESGADHSGVSFTNNKFQVGTSTGYIYYVEFSPVDKISFSGNQYYINTADGSRYRVSGSSLTDAAWASLSGDDSTFEGVTFPDSTRSIETYMASLGETATIDAFIAKSRAQDRYNWDTRFTADAVNDYIRAGFGVSEYTPPGQARRLSLAGRPIKLAEPGP